MFLYFMVEFASGYSVHYWSFEFLLSKPVYIKYIKVVTRVTCFCETLTLS